MELTILDRSPKQRSVMLNGSWSAIHLHHRSWFSDREERSEGCIMAKVSRFSLTGEYGTDESDEV